MTGGDRKLADFKLLVGLAAGDTVQKAAKAAGESGEQLNKEFQLPDNVTIKTSMSTEFLSTPSANDTKGLRDAAELCRAQAARIGDAPAKWFWTQATIYDHDAARVEQRMHHASKERDSTPVPPAELRQMMEDPQDKKEFQDFSGETITDPIRLSITEAAIYIGVTDHTIRDWRKKCKLTVIENDRGQLVFSKSSLEILRNSRK